MTSTRDNHQHETNADEHRSYERPAVVARQTLTAYLGNLDIVRGSD